MWLDLNRFIAVKSNNLWLVACGFTPAYKHGYISVVHCTCKAIALRKTRSIFNYNPAEFTS
jgi:hypothetical protein